MRLPRLTIAFAALILLSGCAMTHEYGPYMGKVVDKETNEPIEGAVVFMRFYTLGLFSVSHYADAVEVLTDQNGEFEIPAHRIYVFRPVNWWEDWGVPIIFKPGYGAYPRHPDISINIDPPGLLPEGRHVTIMLPKLKTMKEREENVIGIWPGSGVPASKYSNLQRLIKIEFNQLDKGN